MYYKVELRTSTYFLVFQNFLSKTEMASSGLLSEMTIRLVKCGSSLVVKQVRQWIPISQRNKIFQKYDLQFPIDCNYC